MAPENAPIFRETGLKRDIGKFIHRNDYLQEKERLLNNFDENKAVRRSKFHKKSLVNVFHKRKHLLVRSTTHNLEL